MLRACLEIIAEGVIELPVAIVAERSGVNRGTVYRWWPTPAAMLSDALDFHTAHRLDAPDTGSWVGDIRAFATQLADLSDEPIERGFLATMATGRYPLFNDLMLSTYQASLPSLLEMVNRAVARGEVSPNVDPMGVISLLSSPIVATSLLGGRRLTSKELDVYVDLASRATAPEGDLSSAASAPSKAKVKPAAKRSPAKTHSRSVRRAE